MVKSLFLSRALPYWICSYPDGFEESFRTPQIIFRAALQMSSTFSVLSVDVRACKGWFSRVKKHGAVIRIMVLLCLVSGAARGEIKHVCLERSMARVQTAKLFTQRHIGISTENTCRPWGNVRMRVSCAQNSHWRMLGAHVSLQIGLCASPHIYIQYYQI